MSKKGDYRVCSFCKDITDEWIKIGGVKMCSKCLRDSQENKTLYVSSGGRYKGGSHD